MTDQAITVSNVVQQYPFARARTLNDVSFGIPSQRVTLLLGENGSGKSTLLNCMAGIIPFESGRITVSVNGKASYTLNGGAAPRIPIGIRKSVGVIFQHKALWPHFSVLENMRHPLRRVHTTLSAETVADRIKKYLDKLQMHEEILTKYPSQLSGGQQRKVAIARTLAIEPDLLVIDELEANLDQPSLELVLNLLEEDFVSTGKTVVMISHRPDLVERFVPYVVVLKSGGGGEESVVSARNVDALMHKSGKPSALDYVARVTSAAKPWFFANQCLSAATEIQSLTLSERNEGRLLEQVGTRIASLISKLDPDMSHLLLIATRSGSDYMIRSAEVTGGFKLDGKHAHKLSSICDAVSHSTIDGSPVPVSYTPKRGYRKLIDESIGISLGADGPGHNGLIDWIFDEGWEQWTYQESKYSEEVKGAFWMGIPIPYEHTLERKSYNEFSKDTKNVYMIAIKIDNEVKGVVSIDTTAQRKWSNFVMEQLVLIANMAAIAMKQLENGKKPRETSSVESARNIPRDRLP